MENKKSINVIAIFSAIAVAAGVYQPFVSSAAVLGHRLNFTAMDHTYGWVFFVVAGVGFLFALLGINSITFLSGLAGFCLALIGYWKVMGGNYQVVQLLSHTVMEGQLGFFLILGGSFVMMISSLVHDSN